MLKFYEGGFHDLLNDLDKELVMQDIEDWIDHRIPAADGDQVRTQVTSF
jgi:acylglycerol lipase